MSVFISGMNEFSIRWKKTSCTYLTHWGRVTHICVGELTIIGSDNGLSPGRRQAIIWTNAGILLIGPLGTKFNEILIEFHTFSLKKMRLKVSSAKWRPFYLGLNVLKEIIEGTFQQCHMSAMASQIKGNLTLCWTVCSGHHERQYQRSGSLAFCEGNTPVTDVYRCIYASIFLNELRNRRQTAICMTIFDLTHIYTSVSGAWYSQVLI